MTQATARQLKSSALHALLGIIGVAAVSYTCYRLDLGVAMSAMLYLIAVVLLSLGGRFLSSAAIAVAAALSLHYFIVPPRLSFGGYRPIDFAALVAFLITALVITRLLDRAQRSLEEARRARDELALALDTIPALVWTTRPDGSSEMSNERWLSYTGLSREAAREWGYTSAIHPDDYAGLVPRWSTSFQSGTPIEDEARLRRADGVYRWFLHRAVPLRDRTGTILKWYGTSFDIEDRKQTQEQVRERARLLDLTHDTVFVRDVNDVITYWNRGAEELYGWTSQEAIGRVSHELTRAIFPAPLEEITAVLHRTGRWEGELIHTKRDGSRVIVASRWSLQRDEQEQAVAVLETNNDITDRKRAERGLRRARQRALKVRFAAILEERTRLAREIHDTLLQGFTGVALKLVAASKQVSQPADAVASLRDVISLAQKTLVDARSAVWDLRAPSLAPAGLAATLRSTVEDCLRGTDLTLEYAVEGIERPLAPDIEGTVVRVGQEAVTNCVKHARAHTVWVTLAYGDRAVRLSVRDDGSGFSVDSNLQAFGGHWGLLGMRERATRIRGKFKIRSTPGQGTEIVLLAPSYSP
jgi:PAS domain S-box-containing protein